ncbi:xanthine dehydrogenase small subunit [Inhella inkyongensis]|uniref:Xanthine dehydrogenase small subunit n=1 Tax=Inhella inkyongensis TaxID=392593 RepID=A0A840S4P6_9BURK|nr:xanthine dehydrogenase small subunit [Inhella inkyongensis]MBB5205355.1 xanthine dehydrogenase small subunit [Inhella inkyongensis]
MPQDLSTQSIRPVRFWHRNAVVELDGAPNTRTVLEWLREDQQLCGTKEGCAEGDCGACTVVLGELDAQGRLQLKPVNSCIQFLPSLDGKALFTVEDLAGADGSLHPVQQALVDCHGSQCGFCTPGFAMSLWQLYEEMKGTAPSRQGIADGLAGNLCRCTGYRPILDAGEKALAQEGPLLDREPVETALRELALGQPIHTEAGFHAPKTLGELAQLRQDLPEARLLAGGSDVGLWVTKQFKTLPQIIYLGQVRELQTIERVGDELVIGAGASLEAAWAELATHWPQLKEMGLRFASPPIRSVGTLGGNIANGSPIGDGAPVLMALGATVELQRGEQLRRLPLQDFYLDYMKNALQAGEFLRALRVPLPLQGWRLSTHKISKRFDSDISAVCGAFALHIEDGQVREARLAWGGMAAIVKRAAQAEAALRGQPWNEATLIQAQAALAQDFKPLSDMRASAAYRLQVAQNLLRRCWLETRAEDPLPASALSVWEAR